MRISELAQYTIKEEPVSQGLTFTPSATGYVLLASYLRLACSLLAATKFNAAHGEPVERTPTRLQSRGRMTVDRLGDGV